MMSAIREKVDAWMSWIYDWVTVIVASLVGVPTLILQLLSYFDDVNIAPLIGSDLALKIVTGVAIAKAILAFWESRTKPR